MKQDNLILETNKNFPIFANRTSVSVSHYEPFKKLIRKQVGCEKDSPDSYIDTHLPVVFLIELESNQTEEDWLKKNYEELFKGELHDWWEGDKHPEINFANFNKYFKVEFSCVVIDFEAGKPIEMI